MRLNSAAPIFPASHCRRASFRDSGRSKLPTTSLRVFTGASSGKLAPPPCAGDTGRPDGCQGGSSVDASVDTAPGPFHLIYNPPISARRLVMTTHRLTRRKLLKTAAAGAAVVGFPLPLRAQPKAFKIGVIHTVTGPLAEPGQACRVGAQMAADAINAAGGIKAKGGMRLELILGDTQTKADVARTEAERVVNQGAQFL